MADQIKILIADDHKIFREGLKFILTEVSNFDVIAEVENGKECISIVENELPDIILMDIEMPVMNGIETTEILVKKHPEIKIIALSSYGEEAYYYKMIKAGASGFVQKKSGKKDLESAIQIVAQGNNYFSQDLLHKIIFNVSNEGESSFLNQNIKISKRENEVLVLISQGLSNKEIGEKLFISPKTVDNHRTNLLSKTGTNNSASLIMYAIKNKILSI